MWQEAGSPRTQALRWWNNLPIEKRKEAVSNWKVRYPKYSDWDYELISKSSNLVESVFTYFFQCGAK
jgi:hypothetical protein